MPRIGQRGSLEDEGKIPFVWKWRHIHYLKWLQCLVSYYLFYFPGKENQNPSSCETRFCGQTERKIVEKEETNFARWKGTKGKSYFIFKLSGSAYEPAAAWFPGPVSFRPWLGARCLMVRSRSAECIRLKRQCNRPITPRTQHTNRVWMDGDEAVAFVAQANWEDNPLYSAEFVYLKAGYL